MTGLRSGYWADARAKAAFRRFVLDIHRLDFTAWDEAGCWDDAYRPFSLFEGGRVVANVCVYSLDVVVDGEPTRAAQISAVGTAPELRRRGLARALHDEAMRWARGTGHRFFFLFADDDAVPFYRRLGFVPAPEHAPVVAVRGAEPRPGARRLDLGDEADRRLVQDLARRRAPASRRLGILSERLLMFHALVPLRACAYHLPALDAVAFASRRGATLLLHDVVAPRMPAFDRIYEFLSAPGDAEVELGFLPDELQLGGLSWRPIAGSNLHLSADAPLREPFLFPATAHA